MRHLTFMHRYAAQILWVVGGGILGFGYYYFIGCTTGGCPLQSNAYLMIGYGALIGLVVGIPGKKSAKRNEEEG